MEKHPVNKKPYDKLYAVLSVDKRGFEGLVVLNIPMFGPQLAVTGDEKNLDHFVQIAKAAMSEAQDAGLKIVIGEFQRTKTTELDE